MADSEHEVHSSSHTEAEKKIDVYEILARSLRGFRAYWWIVILITLIGGGLGYGLARMTYHPRYQASTSFTISRKTGDGYTVSYYNSAATQMAQTFPYIISSSALKKLIQDDLQTSNISSDIKAEAMEGTNLFTITVEDSNADMAYLVLQSVVKNYPSVARFIIGETQLVVMEDSGIPEKPIKALDAKGMMKKCAAAGFLLACALIVLDAVYRRTITRESDFGKFLNVRCVGSVPKVYFKKRRSQFDKSVLLTNEHLPGEYRDMLRIVRTRVLRTLQERGEKTFMITSSIPREGKSTVAVNLAMSIAHVGKKVILIDGDLRNPTTAEILGTEITGPGLLDVMNGTANLQEAIQFREKENIYILLKGQGTEANRTNIIAQPFEEIINQLEEMMDVVIVDTPPVGMLADALSIAGRISQVVYIVRQDYAGIGDIIEGIRNIQENGIQLIGCVLNYAKESLLTNGAGYHTGYSGYTYMSSSISSAYSYQAKSEEVAVNPNAPRIGSEEKES